MRKSHPSCILSLALVLALAACGTGGDDTRSSGSPATTVESHSGRTELPPPPTDRHHHQPERRQRRTPRTSTVPYDPQRIAILDMASLDILDALGLAGTGWWAPPPPAWTTSRATSTTRTWRTWAPSRRRTWKPSWPAEPDVIFIGGRLASSYDSLSEIAPVVYLATDTETGRGGQRGEERPDHRLPLWPGGSGRPADGGV